MFRILPSFAMLYRGAFVAITPTFVDTSAFYALLVKGDRMHPRASALDETATLLKARGHGHLSPSSISGSS